MEKVQSFDPKLLMVIAPLAIIGLTLLIISYLDLLRREQVRGGRKWVWALVILISFVGPIAYLTMGREE